MGYMDATCSADGDQVMKESMNLVLIWLRSRYPDILSFVMISSVFYLMSYYSVSDLQPSSIPVHHDDYTNYSSSTSGIIWSWIRPLSTVLIYALSTLGPDWLIWTVRILVVAYVFMCWNILRVFVGPGQYWISLALFSMSVLSSPIIVEYARYTGMITHMTSGCLGLAAVNFLFKYDRNNSYIWICVSVIFLLLSSLAKEDFILFYAFSFVYVLFKSKKSLNKQVLIGLIGLVISLLMVAGSKFFAESSFLGVSDAQHPYFIDISPISVAMTVWSYLMGSGHPAMRMHGQFIAAVMIFSSISTLVVILRNRTLPKTFYLIGAVLTLIAPYSVLPNHVNLYYELIWLPFIIGSVFVAVSDIISARSALPLRSYLVCASLTAICVSLNVVDMSGRFSVARWYDAVELDNAKFFKYLEDNRAIINSSPKVCVYGASAFSPWYLHNGQYLENVMGLYTVWNIIVDKSSPLYTGFLQGAASSKGRVVVSGSPGVNESCLKISIGEVR